MSDGGIAGDPHIQHTFGDFRVCNERDFGICDMAIGDFELRVILLDSVQDGCWFAEWKKNK